MQGLLLWFECMVGIAIMKVDWDHNWWAVMIGSSYVNSSAILVPLQSHIRYKMLLFITYIVCFHQLSCDLLFLKLFITMILFGVNVIIVSMSRMKFWPVNRSVMEKMCFRTCLQKKGSEILKILSFVEAFKCDVCYTGFWLQLGSFPCMIECHCTPGIFQAAFNHFASLQHWSGFAIRHPVCIFVSRLCTVILLW